MVTTVIVAMFSAFVTGALARFAVPGPDPMPAWLTVAIGLVGTAIGTGIVIAIDQRGAASWAGIASFLAAVVLVVAYRRLVQKRPLWGPEAYRFPRRGFGVESARERLRRAGIDPDKIGMPFSLQPMAGGPPQSAPGTPRAGSEDDPMQNPAYYLGLLEELHDSGVLDDEEFDAARTRLLERLRA
jgi:uncharacterized membrane protein YeaQ/YmgE (transglycosylase-associated protein family)